jgi:hypothetical protein
MADAPKRLAVGRLEIVDVRHLYPPSPDGAVGRSRDSSRLQGIAVHHDAAIMAPGDQNYDGSTLDEDLRRLDVIYNVGISRGWGGFPYHFVGSPNGRTFYTTDLSFFGAQVAGRNDTLVGVALMGLFTDAKPVPADLCGAALAIVSIWSIIGRLLDVKGHREWALDWSPTNCPGDTWWTWQNDLFAAVRLKARLAFPETP